MRTGLGTNELKKVSDFLVGCERAGTAKIFGSCMLHGTVCFDAIYWNKIDQRFFGSNESGDNVCDL